MGLSSLTSSASKWALFAKDNAVKIGSKAAEKAAELTQKVNDKAKDGSLLTSLQTSVTTIGSKFGEVSTKAWSDVNSFVASSKSGYGSLSGDNIAQQTSRQNSYLQSNSQIKNDDWNWDDWDDKKSNKQQNVDKQSSKTNLANFNNSNDDEWANGDDDDQWEPIETSNATSKSKKN